MTLALDQMCDERDQDMSLPSIGGGVQQHNCPKCTGALPAGAVEVVPIGNRATGEWQRIVRAYCAHCDQGYVLTQRWGGLAWLTAKAALADGQLRRRLRERAERFGCGDAA